VGTPNGRRRLHREATRVAEIETERSLIVWVPAASRKAWIIPPGPRLYARGKGAGWESDRRCLREFSAQLRTRWSQRLDRRALRLTAVARTGKRFALDRGGDCAR
jgi:hypothetical protein